jgi:hypothetical protein
MTEPYAEQLPGEIPDDIAALIEADVDGRITETQAQQLADAAAADPAVGTALADARLTQQFMATQTQAEVPDGFADRVLGALPQRAAWESGSRPAPAAQHYAVRPARPARSRWTLGLGFAAIAACVLVVVMVVAPGINGDGIQATMITPDRALTAGSEDVSISIRQLADEIVVHVISGRAEPVQIAFDPSWSSTPVPVEILGAEATDEYRLPIRASDSGTLVLTGTTPDGTILFRNELQVQP